MPVARGIIGVVAPIGKPTYYAAKIAPGAAAMHLLNEDGSLNQTIAEEIDFSVLNPSIPSLSQDNDYGGTWHIINDGSGLTCDDGTLLAVYPSSPAGDVLVSWQPSSGVVAFRSKLDSNDESIGPACEGAGKIYWAEFDWATSPSTVNVDLYSGEGNLSGASLLSSWGVDSADLNASALGYDVPAEEIKVLVNDEINVLCYIGEDDGIGGTDIWYWWRFSLAGAQLARGTLSQDNFDNHPFLGLNGGVAGPIGANGFLSATSGKTGRSLRRTNQADRTSFAMQWPTTGTWTDVWKWCSLNRAKTEALLYEGSFVGDRRLARDTITGSHPVEGPTVDITIPATPSIDVVGFAI